MGHLRVEKMYGTETSVGDSATKPNIFLELQLTSLPANSCPPRRAQGVDRRIGCLRRAQGPLHRAIGLRAPPRGAGKTGQAPRARVASRSPCPSHCRRPSLPFA
jgi:hypothetical protein